MNKSVAIYGLNLSPLKFRLKFNWHVTTSRGRAFNWWLGHEASCTGWCIYGKGH